MDTRPVVDPIAQPAATELVARAQHVNALVAEMVSTAAPLVEPTVWNGTDAGVFRAAWPGLVNSVRTATADLLDTASDALRSIQRTSAAQEADG
ncbi:hypothetical protein [Streptomyces sp. CoH27]|uniref:hypothetical protein n=1 Tax=Streptomyces sp. CoH27 TaxID=2875763 RepID=UPI001CD52167|nr:hypothetical protein [Streptomyces sp. CoH27]